MGSSSHDGGVIVSYEMSAEHVESLVKEHSQSLGRAFAHKALLEKKEDQLLMEMKRALSLAGLRRAKYGSMH